MAKRQIYASAQRGLQLIPGLVRVVFLGIGTTGRQ